MHCFPLKKNCPTLTCFPVAWLARLLAVSDVLAKKLNLLQVEKWRPKMNKEMEVELGKLTDRRQYQVSHEQAFIFPAGFY